MCLLLNDLVEEQHMCTKHGHGEGGINCASKLDSTMIDSSILYYRPKNQTPQSFCHDSSSRMIFVKSLWALDRRQKDKDGKLGGFLSRLRAFKNEDPKTTQQKAIPKVVIPELTEMQFSGSQITISKLAIRAFFFLTGLANISSPSNIETEIQGTEVERHQAL